MSEETDQISLEQAIENLKRFEEFQMFTDFLNGWKDQSCADLRSADNPNEVMKLAGTIATLTELLDLAG